MKICYRDLQNAASEILRHVGENEENAQIASEIMVVNDLRGVSTHGTNLLRMIAKRCEAKMLSLPSRVTVVSDNMATLILDGGDGLGQVAGYKAMNAAIEKARLYGLGMALIRNTNNVGSLGYYVHKTAMQDMAAIMMTNGNPSMCEQHQINTMQRFIWRLCISLLRRAYRFYSSVATLTSYYFKFFCSSGMPNIECSSRQNLPKRLVHW